MLFAHSNVFRDFFAILLDALFGILLNLELGDVLSDWYDMEWPRSLNHLFQSDDEEGPTSSQPDTLPTTEEVLTEEIMNQDVAPDLTDSVVAEEQPDTAVEVEAPETPTRSGRRASRKRKVEATPSARELAQISVLKTIEDCLHKVADKCVEDDISSYVRMTESKLRKIKDERTLIIVQGQIDHVLWNAQLDYLEPGNTQQITHANYQVFTPEQPQQQFHSHVVRNLSTNPVFMQGNQFPAGPSNQDNPYGQSVWNPLSPGSTRPGIVGQVCQQASNTLLNL